MNARKHQIVIDLEFNPTNPTTTRAGLKNEIVEIGAVRLNEVGRVVDTFACYVKPEYNSGIELKITKLTGIRTCDIAEAHTFEIVLQEFVTWIGGDDVRIVTWSKNDREQIVRECSFKNIDVPHQLRHWLDLQIVYPRIMGIGNWKRHMSLRDAADWYASGMDEDKAHRALYDARVTAEMMSDLISGEYLEVKKTYEEKIPLRKKSEIKVLSSSIGAACAGLEALKMQLLASSQVVSAA